MSDAEKLFQAKELESICVVNADGRNANLKATLERGTPLVTQKQEREGPLAIVASGPSVRDYLEEIRTWPGEVWAINGAYDYLLDNEIVPAGFFAIDPLPGLVEYVQNPRKETIFYVAATCDPSVFEALAGYDVQVFFPADSYLQYPDGWIIGGGTTALTRVPYLGILQGWRDITLFGCDSSFDGHEYCYEWGRYSTDINSQKFWMVCGNKGPFETEIGLMKQVSQIGALMGHKFNGMVKVKCGGLMDAFLNSPIYDDSVIDVLPNDPIPDEITIGPSAANAAA